MRQLKRKAKTPVPKWLMAVVILIEVAMVGLFLRGHRDARVTRGFLVKVGNEYILSWKNLGDEGFQSKNYHNVKEAVTFARENLELLPGRNVYVDDSIEHMWVRSDTAGHALFWKTLSMRTLNRMTFMRLDEALFFQRVFRMGAYSPSPLGHAVNFVPFEYR